MADEIMSKIHFYLQGSKIVNENVSNKDLYELIFGRSEKRLEILQYLVSQFSEDYNKELQQAENIYTELVQTLHELELTTSANRILFFQGKCSIKEQKVVYHKLIKFLDMALCPRKPLEDDLRIKLLDNISNQPNPVKRGATKCKKQKKAFDLTKAVENLEQCKTFLQTLKVLDNKAVSDSVPDKVQHDNFQVSCDSLNLKESDFLLKQGSCVEDCETAISSMVSLVPKINQLEHSQHLHSESRGMELVYPALSTNVTKLHSILKSVNAVKGTSTNKIDMTQDFDAKKMLEEIKTFETSSHILKLKASK